MGSILSSILFVLIEFYNLLEYLIVFQYDNIIGGSMSKNQETQKRPGWVWVISLWLSVSAGWTLLSLFLIFSGLIELNGGQEAYFNALSPFDYVLSIGISLANFSGAIYLFFLKRIAYYLFLGALILNILTSIWHVVSGSFVEALGVSGLIGALIGLLLLIII